MNLASRTACATCHLVLTKPRTRAAPSTGILSPRVGTPSSPLTPANCGRVRPLPHLHRCATGANYHTGLIHDRRSGRGRGLQRPVARLLPVRPPHRIRRCRRSHRALRRPHAVATPQRRVRHPAHAAPVHPARQGKPGAADRHRLAAGPDHRRHAPEDPRPAHPAPPRPRPPARTVNDPGHRRTLADQLGLAPMYWINQEFTDRIDDVTTTQPAATVTDDLVISPAGLIAWPTPVGATRQLAAVSWTPHLDGWQIIGYCSIGTALDDGLMPALRHEIGWLTPIHTEHLARRATLDGHHPLGPLITTWLLIHQQLTETVPAKLPKGTTKAYQRPRRPAPDVRIVRIAPRPATTPEPSAPAGPRIRAKPDHRFWVSGHERQQAYGPGRSLRRPVDIHPFLKGDKDLPIKLSTTVRVLGDRTAGTEPPTDQGRHHRARHKGATAGDARTRIGRPPHGLTPPAQRPPHPATRPGIASSLGSRPVSPDLVTPAATVPARPSPPQRRKAAPAPRLRLLPPTKKRTAPCRSPTRSSPSVPPAIWLPQCRTCSASTRRRQRRRHRHAGTPDRLRRPWGPPRRRRCGTGVPRPRRTPGSGHPPAAPDHRHRDHRLRTGRPRRPSPDASTTRPSPQAGSPSATCCASPAPGSPASPAATPPAAHPREPRSTPPPTSSPSRQPPPDKSPYRTGQPWPPASPPSPAPPATPCTTPPSKRPPASPP